MGIEKVAFPDDTLELAEALVDKTPSDTRHAGVYVIYNGDTNEPLYVGESKNVYQRLFDHHQRLDSGSNTVREHVEEDEKLDKETEQGAMWEWTEWAWIPVTEGKRNVRRSSEQLN